MNTQHERIFYPLNKEWLKTIHSLQRIILVAYGYMNMAQFSKDLWNESLNLKFAEKMIKYIEKNHNHLNKPAFSPRKEQKTFGVNINTAQSGVDFEFDLNKPLSESVTIWGRSNTYTVDVFNDIGFKV